jgi:hypothetical protein
LRWCGGLEVALPANLRIDMGGHNVEQQVDERKLQAFMKALLEDLRALAFMLENGCVESGVTRIGAEQEMFLIDRNLRPAPLSMEVLKQANDARLTTEIARFNLEANLTPLHLTGSCFSQMERELHELVTLARKSAEGFGADVLLSGILPTLKKSDLTLENLTPIARYRELDRGVIRLRGGPLSIHIKGLDELQITHDNIMMESCNTSFQVHCSRAGQCRQLATFVWSSLVAGNAGGVVPTFNRCPVASSTGTQSTYKSQFWGKMVGTFRHCTLSQSDFSLPADYDYAAG